MPSFLIAAVLLCIFLGFSFSRFLNQADAGLLNSGEVIRLTMLKLFIALEVLLPIALFFGLMLGLGSLHRDSEILAMQAGGISEARMLRPVLTLAIPLALAIAALSIYGRPWAYAQTYAMLAIAEASSDIGRIKAGQFYLTRRTALSEETAANLNEDENGPRSQDRERAVFVENITPDQALEYIFIRTRTGSELQIISAQSGQFVERHQAAYHTLELNNARIFKRVDDGPDLFARIDHFTMNVASAQPEPPGYKAKSVASADLMLSPNPEDQAEYQWRVSTPVSTLLLALLAVPLSRGKPRHSRYTKLLFALIIYAAYFNLMSISRTWVEQQTTTSIWWAPFFLALLVAVFFTPWGSLRFFPGIRQLDQN